jgi:hypothetical protein
LARVVFTESWGPYFEKLGLKSFEDFFKYDKGTVVNNRSRREVLRFELGAGGEVKTFFMKRFHRPYIKDMLFSHFSFGRGCSQGQLEFKNANLLLENNIETYRPVCFGEKFNMGIESESFLVTQEIDGICLTDWLGANYENLTGEQMDAVMVSMADFVRRIHKAGFSMPDLYVWHLYMLNPVNMDDLQWAVIDLHRMSHNVRNVEKKIKNLGSLDLSMLDKYFTAQMKKTFIKAYIKNDGLFADIRIAEKIKKRSAAIYKKRGDREY